MKQIAQFEELRVLPNCTKVMVFYRGNYTTIIVIETIPNSKSIVVLDNYNWSKPLLIGESYFTDSERVFILESSYNSKEAGELMIKQITEYAEKEIENIKAIYFEKV